MRATLAQRPPRSTLRVRHCISPTAARSRVGFVVPGACSVEPSISRGAIQRRRRHPLFARDVLGHYTLTPSTGAQAEADILAAAEDILARRLYREASIGDPRDMEQFLRMRLGHLPHEVFDAVWLDNRHRVIGVERLATGTVDGASIHPREVVKAALRANASAVVFSHNHPSAVTTESAADRAITKELQAALALVGTRVLDHLIVGPGQECTSFAARGLL